MTYSICLTVNDSKEWYSLRVEGCLSDWTAADSDSSPTTLVIYQNKCHQWLYKCIINQKLVQDAAEYKESSNYSLCEFTPSGPKQCSTQYKWHIAFNYKKNQTYFARVQTFSFIFLRLDSDALLPLLNSLWFPVLHVNEAALLNQTIQYAKTMPLHSGGNKNNPFFINRLPININLSQLEMIAFCFFCHRRGNNNELCITTRQHGDGNSCKTLFRKWGVLLRGDTKSQLSA